MKKQNTEERQRLIVEVMTLAFAVHENTDYCIFIDFSGHVNSFSISIRESKERWQNKVCETELATVIGEYQSAGDVDSYLKAAKDVLTQILKDGEIPYEMLTRHVDTVYHYTF